MLYKAECAVLHIVPPPPLQHGPLQRNGLKVIQQMKSPPCLAIKGSIESQEQMKHLLEKEFSGAALQFNASESK